MMIKIQLIHPQLITKWINNIQIKIACIGDGTLYVFQSLKNISLQIFEVFDSKAEPDQVIVNPILGPFRLGEIPGAE